MQQIMGRLASSREGRSVAYNDEVTRQLPLRLRGLPTTQVVTENGPHPLAELVTIAARHEPTCSPPTSLRGALGFGLKGSTTLLVVPHGGESHPKRVMTRTRPVAMVAMKTRLTRLAYSLATLAAALGAGGKWR
jgi:hypothetical protein